MVHHFLNKGFKLDELVNLNSSDRAFHIASSRLAREEKIEIVKALQTR